MATDDHERQLAQLATEVRQLRRMFSLLAGFIVLFAALMVLVFWDRTTQFKDVLLVLAMLAVIAGTCWFVFFARRT